MRLRVVVWLDRSNGESITVESAGFIEQESGADVMVFRRRVRTPVVDHECDCPRVIRETASAAFICTWIEGDLRSGAAPNIRYATLPILAYGGSAGAWVDQGVLVATSEYCMYDVCTALDSTDTWFLIHRNTVNGFQIRKWVATIAAGGFTWTTTHTVDASNRVLCCAAHVGDNQFVYAYERNHTLGGAYAMDCNTVAVNSGVPGTAWKAGATTGIYLQGGLARIQNQRWLLVAEVAHSTFSAGNYQKDTSQIGSASEPTAIHYRVQNTNTGAVVGVDNYTRNLRLLSRPWSWVHSRVNATQSNVYAIVGFSDTTRTDYGQSRGFVVNFDAPELLTQTAQHRLRPIANINLQLLDARRSGWTPSTAHVRFESTGRRVNHVSHASDAPSVGPFRKGKVVALAAWSRMISVGTETLLVSDSAIPVENDILLYRCMPEEPWAYERDPSEDSDLYNPKVPWAWDQFQPVEVADMLAIVGGTPSIYDGQRVVESGFSWSPEIVLVAADAGGTGLAAGTYFYTAIYEWRDRMGHVHRSAPSTPVELTFGGTFTARLQILCQNLSAKIDDFHFSGTTPISIVVYRTANNGTVFYRLFGNAAGTGQPNTIDDTPYSLPDDYIVRLGFDGVTAADFDGDSSSDALLTDNDVLPWQYLNGAWTTLVPTQPPASSVGCVWKNRLWIVPNETPSALWYSLEIQPGPGQVAIAAPEFSPVNVFRLDAEPLVITALLALDEQLVVFTRDAVYVLTGSLNDDTGNGQSLELRKRANVACLSQRSVARVPGVGIFFQSDRGLQLMDDAGNVDNVSIGSMVQDDVESGGNIRGAMVDEARQKVVFATNGGEVDGEPRFLVYDYHHKIWTRHTLPLGDQTSIGDGDDRLCNVMDCAIWRGAEGESLRVILEQGSLLVERPSTTAPTIRYADSHRSGNGTATSDAYSRVDIQTGWINLAGVAGLKRVWEVGLLCTTTASGDEPDLDITLDYDLDGSYSGSLNDTFTHEAPYVAYVRCRPRIQLLTALRIRIRDAGTYTNKLEWSVSSATLRCGVHRGLRRVPNTQIAS